MWGSLDRPCPQRFEELKEGIMDIRIGNETVYCLTSKGELYEIKLPQKKETKAEISQMKI